MKTDGIHYIKKRRETIYNKFLHKKINTRFLKENGEFEYNFIHISLALESSTAYFPHKTSLITSARDRDLSWINLGLTKRLFFHCKFQINKKLMIAYHL